MNIIEAIKEIRNGKTIRRKGNCCTYTLDRGVIYVHKEEIRFFSVDDISSFVTQEDYIANDWEVVE